MSKTILPYIKQLNAEYRIILASGSPRRRELLSLIGLQHEVMVSSFAENLEKSRYESPQEYCRHTAEEKVFDVARTLNGLEKKTLVIGADTIVAIDGRVLEKPADEREAHYMISSLSGRTHEVHTAVVLFSNFHDPVHALTKSMTKVDSFVVSSNVTFARLSEADIEAYVATGEGNDKAGSYGIQGLGGQMVQGIEGCYFNVMGLPIQALSARIAKLLEDTASL
jgi:septum formation protein